MANTHKHILAYFQDLNAKLADFPDQSFYRMDVDEVLDALRSGIKFPALAMVSPEGDTEESKIDNTVIGRMFDFSVLQNPTSGNFAEQNEMLDQCERIGLKIIARMRLDNETQGNFIFRKFQIETVKWFKVGPLYNENLYGYRFMGMLKDNEPLVVDPADWSDIDKLCGN